MVYFGFICLLKLILYISKPQNQMCDQNQKSFCFALKKSENKLSTWLIHLILRFHYIIGCSGPRCGATVAKFSKQILKLIYLHYLGCQKNQKDLRITTMIRFAASFQPNLKKTWKITKKLAYFDDFCWFWRCLCNQFNFC